MPDHRTAKFVSPGGGEWVSWMGRPIRHLVNGEDTDGTYALTWGLTPTGSGAPPHRHAFAEGFYVLKGEIEFKAGNKTIRLCAGGFIAINAGTAHSFRNPGPGDAEFLGLLAPSGFEKYQSLVGQPVADGSGPFEPPPADIFDRMSALAPPELGVEVNLPDDAFLADPEIVVRQPGEGPAFAVVGDLYTFLAEGEHTSGKFAIWDAIVPPGGGPPPHIQTREHEGFYILEGELTFYAEGSRVVAGPGTFLNVPPGVVHAFKNETDQPAHQLIFVAPAGLEQQFRETGEPVADRSAPIPAPTQAGIERLLAVAPRYGVEVRVP